MNQPKKERFKTSVGGQALSEFVKVRHAVPLESLQDEVRENVAGRLNDELDG